MTMKFKYNTHSESIAWQCKTPFTKIILMGTDCRLHALLVKTMTMICQKNISSLSN